MSAAVDATVVGARLGHDFFARPAAAVAPALIGCTLLVDGVGGVIVETERYQDDDPASHSFRGPRGRALVMFGPPGHLYVYRSYGIHWCANVVCDAPGRGCAVLIRAVEPVWGMDAMRERRGPLADRLLCAGPGRLCQALAIDATLNDAPLTDAAGRASIHAAREGVEIAVGPRIGISAATENRWRFGLAGSRYLSRPFPRP